MFLQGHAHVAVNKGTLSHRYVYNTLWLPLGHAPALQGRLVTAKVSGVVITGRADIWKPSIVAKIQKIRATIIDLTNTGLAFLVLFKPCLVFKILLKLNKLEIFWLQVIVELLVNQVKIHEVGNGVQHTAVVRHYVSHSQFYLGVGVRDHDKHLV